MTQSDRWTAASIAVTALLMLIAIVLVFGVAPDPANLQTPVEQAAQRIFYGFHWLLSRRRSSSSIRISPTASSNAREGISTRPICSQASVGK